MDAPLRKLAERESVENVYLFVADSVRARATSDEVKSVGVSGRAIAPSTYTASSFPSLVSGDYPASHCVWSFDDQLPTRPALLNGPETFGMAAETIWTDLPSAEKPPFRIINATDKETRRVEKLSPPFVAVEHHKGGHMPYGYSFAEYESTETFFEEQRPSLSALPDLYRQSVRDAEKRFLAALSDLKERDIFDETLVIYTSDHGEALGEEANGATIGHGDPICPDLVDVPIVFAGAGLQDEELGYLASGTDIAPTALSALGRPGQTCDGRDLWTTVPTENRHRAERWVQYELPVVGEVDRYRGRSVWDESGGIVFQDGSRLTRLVLAVGNEFIKAPWSYLNRSPSSPRRLVGFLRRYLESHREYGTPNFSAIDADEATEEFSESADRGRETIDEEQLRKLGYL